MQDEHSEGVGKDNPESQESRVSKWEFALSVLKEAVASAGIKDISEYKGEPLDLRWHVFSQENDKDVVLKMLVKGIFGYLHADVSLIRTAKWVIDELELALTRPDATRILDFSEEERPEILRENARMILTGYINQIPVVAFQILSQSLNDTIQSHIKTYVEPRLKEHWKSLGLPKDFTVSPSEDSANHLKSVDEQFNIVRQSFLGNRRARLTDEKRANLDDEHEQLRSDYQIAKDYYNQSRKAFFAGKRNRTEDEWTEEWNTQSYRMFPTLYYRCLDEINNYPPYELAHIHLANFYGYGTEYIKKLVSQASALKPKASYA
jgi:hypothetical protein